MVDTAVLLWRMRLLISNDDGIYSPGIRALAEVAREFGEVRIVAPDVEQSAMGHAITISRPLTYHKTPIEGFDAYRVNGDSGRLRRARSRPLGQC